MKNPGQSQPYNVGYRKPPKASRFRKGRSGNPRGRKPSDENFLSIFKRLAARPVKVNDGEKVRTISFAEAIILQNYKAAVQKDANAMGNMLRLAERAGELTDWTDPKVVGLPIIMPRKMSKDEFMAFYGVETVTISSQTSGSPED
jgi:hypothetical protein